MIRGWANYHRHVVSKRTFKRVDHATFSSLWLWGTTKAPEQKPTMAQSEILCATWEP
jgi:RNA-directed DNA polymerase